MSSSSASSSSTSPGPVSAKKASSKRKEPKQISDASEEESSYSGSDSKNDDDGSVASDDAADESDDDNEVDDAPALSHAERRRQKKKEKLAARKQKANGDSDQVSEPPAKKRKLADDNSADSSKSRQNSIWVGNMSFKTTPQALRTFFDGVGEITRIHMPMKVQTRSNVPPENRGFAYVDFSTPEAKAIAIALSERPLIGRKLLIKDGDDFAGRPALASDPSNPLDPSSVPALPGGQTHSKTALKILRAQKQPPAPTLFLGNLGFETTEAAIRELFDAHRFKRKDKKEGKDTKAKAKGSKEKDSEADSDDEGMDIDGKDDKDAEEKKVKVSKTEGAEEKEEDWIRKVRMGTFEDSGLCKGFAFVDFSSIPHATAALTNPRNHHLNGRNLVVEYASADAVRRGPNKPKLTEEERAAKDAARRENGRGRGGGRGGRGARGGDRGGRGGRGGERAPLHNGYEAAVPNPNDSSSPSRKRAREEDGEQDSYNQRKRLADDGDFAPRHRDFKQHKGSKHRPKPGAALAEAKRQSAAIVENALRQGAGGKKKIVF